MPLALARVDQSVDLLKALADPTRLQIVGVLKGVLPAGLYL